MVDVPDSEKTVQEKINVNGEETGQLSPFWTEVYVSVEKLGDISVNDMVKEQKKTYYENNKDKIKKQGQNQKTREGWSTMKSMRRGLRNRSCMPIKWNAMTEP